MERTPPQPFKLGTCLATLALVIQYFLVPLFMAGLAKPHDIKRFVIVFVVRKAFDIAAPDARLANQLTRPHRTSNSIMALLPAFVGSTPSRRYFRSSFATLRVFSPNTVILPIVVQLLTTVLMDINLVALFAFVDMTVSHLRMFIKLL
jgi:hypothetical protein